MANGSIECRLLGTIEARLLPATAGLLACTDSLLGVAAGTVVPIETEPPRLGGGGAPLEPRFGGAPTEARFWYPEA